MLSEETATSAFRIAAHGQRLAALHSPRSASALHMRYGLGSRSQMTSMSVCSTEYPRPTKRATSPVRIMANFFQLPDECWSE